MDAALAGNRQDALDRLRLSRRLERGEAKERPNGRQSKIPAAGANSPLILEIVQEGAYERSVDLFDGELRRLLAKPGFGEQQEEVERVPV